MELFVSAAGLVVEMVGPPGCGKSLLAARVVDELTARGLPAEDAWAGFGRSGTTTARLARKAVAVSREIGTHPIGAAAVLLAVVRSRQPTTELVVKRTVNWLALRALLRRARRMGGIHLFDQGIVQELWSVALEGRPEPMFGVSTPGSAAMGPDVLVRVDADVEFCAANLATRGTGESRLEQLRGEECVAAVESGDRYLAELEKRWHQALESADSDRPVIERLVVTSRAGEMDSVAKLLADQFAELIRASHEDGGLRTQVRL